MYGFWGSLLGKLCTTSNWKNHQGSSFFCVKMNFAKKTDDHVVYFDFFDYIY